MLRLFHRRNKRLLIGVDISSTAVKILELSKKNGRYQVESYGVSLLDEGCVFEKNILNSDAVIEALRQALRIANPRSSSAAIAIPTALVIDKLIEIDANLTTHQRELQIRIEAEQYIPFPLNQVNLDFTYLKEQELLSGRYKVLLAATPTEHVDTRIELLELAGLNAQIVDVEAYALERVYRYLMMLLPEQIDTVALLDIGHYNTTLTVFAQDKTIYSHEQLFGGQQLTQHIQRYYGLSLSEAQRAKQQGVKALPKDYEVEVLSPFLQATVQQAARALHLFQASEVARPIQHIWLAGGSAQLAGLVVLLQQKLAYTVSLVNPFMQMNISAQVDKTQLMHDAPAMLLACGLALRCAT
ncbi:type IV pilus assembly protein PilM [Acinetobacter rudis]|uniref:Type IV pilus assembly protein PilM n=1 Tax=Acinetobacter rudis TaxID=632955 RepID=A0AAW8J914_9GAMM|nr:type IV pilus assembly protein PilM [Acinetobacter rudis]MDQ8935196.1 type IV pilus assembly protein PilM [Acinetobacter rudis]MDQ8953059.1 type IV pilus assembly protein PilM [Acinetobacter rudis]MDQ9017064.1 type IV pilus assembly protein PilM [Acinetobacter rudis]